MHLHVKEKSQTSFFPTPQAKVQAEDASTTRFAQAWEQQRERPADAGLGSHRRVLFPPLKSSPPRRGREERKAGLTEKAVYLPGPPLSLSSSSFL